MRILRYGFSHWPFKVKMILKSKRWSSCLASWMPKNLNVLILLQSAGNKQVWGKIHHKYWKWPEKNLVGWWREGIERFGIKLPFLRFPCFSWPSLNFDKAPLFVTRNCDQLNCLWFHSYKDKIHVCLWISNLLRHSGVRIKDEWMAAHELGWWWWLRLDWLWLGPENLTSENRV